ncbi:MAG: hypothetical protein ABL921_31530, partial [Pirellula sp.]
CITDCLPKAASIAYTCHVAAHLQDPNVAAYLRDAGRSITVRLGDADLRHTFNHFIEFLSHNAPT